MVSFTIFNEWNMLFYNCKVYFEFPAGLSYSNVEKPTNAGLVQTSFYFSSKLPEQMDQTTTELICFSILLLHFIVYLTKVLFELSLGISKFTNFLELGHLAALFTVVVTYMIELVLKSRMNIERYMVDSTDYVYFASLASSQSAGKLCLVICSLFYPFRIIQFLAHIE